LIEEYGTTDIINYQEKVDNTTCFIEACTYNRISVAKALLAKGADPLLCDDDGTNALSWAAVTG